jgi:hypothetical protein
MRSGARYQYHGVSPHRSEWKPCGNLFRTGTVQKPRVANLIKPYKAGRLVNQIKELAESVGQLPRLRRSSDPGDNYLLV